MDNEIIGKLKNKDKEAFEIVMDKYKNSIYNYLYSILGDIDLAEELTQETFVRVYFKAKHLKTDNLRSWIYKIATNLARSEFRKQKIRRFMPIHDMKNEKEISVNYDNIDKISIEELLKKIPEKYRTPLVMKELENFTYEEISKILKKPIGTVKSLIFRGKDMLKEIVKGVKNE